MAGVTGLEFLNNRYDPMGAKLDGWSESIMENINDYDDVFEELIEKYKTSIESPPEIRLLLMLGGSAFMFHLTNQFFKSPNVGDILGNNPDIIRNMANMAKGRKPNEGGQGGQGGQGGLGGMMGGLSGMMGGMNKPTSNSRNEMSGPTGVDDILNELRNEKKV